VPAGDAVISVLTTPRRGHYLERTIRSLEAGGAELAGRRVLCVDGDTGGYVERFPGWEVASVGDGRQGARAAMLAIARLAYAEGADPLLYFEDDVVICRGAVRAMLEIGVPEPLGLVSYCDLMWHEVRPLELRAFPGNPRDYQVADGGFVGCQALALPRRTLERLATFEAPAWLERDPHGCDGTIGMIAEQYGILDSLAQHTGDFSAIMGTAYGPRKRDARGFPGEDFDAAAVPRVFELADPGVRCRLHRGVLHPNGRECGAAKPAHAELAARIFR
jgi:hypothetical protein